MLVVVVYTPQASTSLINLERTRQLKNAATTRSSGITDWVRNGERRIHNSMDSSSTDNSLLPMARQSSSWVMLMLSACSRSFDKVPQWESTLLRIGGRGGPQRQEGRGGTNVTNDPNHARDHTVEPCLSLLMLLHTSSYNCSRQYRFYHNITIHSMCWILTYQKKRPRQRPRTMKVIS